MRISVPYTLCLVVFCFFAFLFSCSPSGDNNKTSTNYVRTKSSFPPAPQFNADSAKHFIQRQVDFGPRIPGTAAHEKCLQFLTTQLKRYGFEVTTQYGRVHTEGKNMPIRNIIGSFRPEKNTRYLLAAHWDTRPVSDRDETARDKPFDGANDGASGVGILLEIARQLFLTQPDLGIDIIFFDMEDYGREYCLGSAFWGRNLHKPGYVAQYGILLDMVGAKGAVFPREGASRKYAPHIVKKVWNKAAQLGYSHYFISEDVHELTDDHINIIHGANIPCINIIHFDPATNDFGPFHHRQSDNMEIIDQNTLKAVGQTILEVIWEEQKANP